MLLDEGDVKALQWRNMSYVTKHDVFGDNSRSERRIKLKLKRIAGGYGLARKEG
jgi:hypothetical protein